MRANENFENRLNTSRGKIKSQKKPEKKCHCKIILSKKTPFPFTTKVTPKKKKVYQDEQFLLDVSGISEISYIEEDEEFMNRESLKEIAIF